MPSLVHVGSQPHLSRETLPMLDAFRLDAVIEAAVDADTLGVALIDEARKKASVATNPWGATGDRLEKHVREQMAQLLETGIISKKDVQPPKAPNVIDLADDADDEQVTKLIKEGMVGTHPDHGGDEDLYREIAQAKGKNPARAVLLAARSKPTNIVESARDTRYRRWYSLYLAGLIDEKGDVQSVSVDAHKLAEQEAMAVMLNRFLLPIKFAHEFVPFVKNLERGLNDPVYAHYSGFAAVEERIRPLVDDGKLGEAQDLMEKVCETSGPTLSKAIEVCLRIERETGIGLTRHRASEILTVARGALLQLDRRLLEALIVEKNNFTNNDITSIVIGGIAAAIARRRAT